MDCSSLNVELERNEDGQGEKPSTRYKIPQKQERNYKSEVGGRDAKSISF